MLTIVTVQIKHSDLKASSATLLDKWAYHSMLRGEEPPMAKKLS